MAKAGFSYPRGTRYSCIGCGKCCSFWTIIASENKVKGIEAFNWTDKYPDLKGSLFKRKKGGKEGEGQYIIKMTRDKRCSFLADENLCLVHKELGYEAKPDGCKVFPMNFVRVQDKVYLRLNYHCPAVLQNDGKPLEHQAKTLNSANRLYSAQSGYEQNKDLTLLGDVRLSYSELIRLETELIKLIRDLPPHTAIAAGLKLLEYIAENMGQGPNMKFNTAFESINMDALPEEAAKLLGSKSKGRFMLSIFLSQDARKNPVSKLLHLVGATAFGFGLMGYSSRLAGTKAGRSKIQKVKLDIDTAQAGDLMRRYLESKIHGKRYLQTTMGIIGGYNFIILALKLTEHYARLIAAGNGKGEVEYEDLEKAIQLADLVAVEHPGYYTSGAITEMINVLLSGQGVGWDLLAV